jgi:hypothetical protein
MESCAPDIVLSRVAQDIRREWPQWPLGCRCQGRCRQAMIAVSVVIGHVSICGSSTVAAAAGSFIRAVRHRRVGCHKPVEVAGVVCNCGLMRQRPGCSRGAAAAGEGGKVRVWPPGYLVRRRPGAGARAPGNRAGGPAPSGGARCAPPKVLSAPPPPPHWRCLPLEEPPSHQRARSAEHGHR